MSLTKPELIAALAEAADVSKAQAEAVLTALIATIYDTVKAADELNITGLGKFSGVDKEAHTGRNPSNGEAIQIPAKRSPKFSAAKALKDAANAGSGKKNKK